MNLHNRNVVYIGGFGGIGYASCLELLQRNLKTLIVMELQEDVSKLAHLQSLCVNTSVFFVPIDLSAKQSIVQAYEQVKALLSNYRLDVVVHGSGVYDDQQPQLTVQVNLLGVIESNLLAFELMDRSRGGQGGLIVNISSVTALIPNPLMAIYSATKAGLLSFTRAMAADFYYSQSGISFITFCPAGTATSLIMTPVNKSTFQFASSLHAQKNRDSRKQTAGECAQGLMNVITNGRNGSVWVCDFGKLKELEMPVLWQREVESARN